MKKELFNMNNKTPVLLNKVMKDIVDTNVTFYKTDLNIDFDCIRKRKDVKSFIWFNRTHGTDIMIEKFIPVKNCFHNVTYKYWLNENPKIYRLTITKVCPKNIYGYIEELDLKTYTSEILAKEKEYSNVKVQLTSNQKKYEVIVPYKNAFDMAISKLKLNPKSIEYYAEIEYYA